MPNTLAGASVSAFAAPPVHGNAYEVAGRIDNPVLSLRDRYLFDRGPVDGIDAMAIEQREGIMNNLIVSSGKLSRMKIHDGPFTLTILDGVRLDYMPVPLDTESPANPDHGAGQQGWPVACSVCCRTSREERPGEG